jgi:hypothetical protein
MPEWIKLVRQRLDSLGLAPGREEEILVELAGHLDDVYAGWIERGVAAEEAVGLTLKEVPDWAGLRQQIYHAEQGEEDMNQRIKSLWVPALLSSLLCWGLLTVLQRIGPAPHFIWRGQSPVMVFYWPWYLFLPVAGAIGAYGSRRAGGGVWGRVVAGLFPAASLVTLMLLSFLVALFVDRQVPLNVKLPALLIYLLGWGVVPGAALLLGALPFLKGRPHEPA